MSQEEQHDAKETRNAKDARRRRGPRRPRFEMRISTKFAPQKPQEGKPLTCTSDTTLKPEQMLELYRYLKLTRLVEERLVNLYRQTKIVGGVFRSLGQEATAVGSAYALESTDFVLEFSALLREGRHATRVAVDQVSIDAGTTRVYAADSSTVCTAPAAASSDCSGRADAGRRLRRWDSAAS